MNIDRLIASFAAALALCITAAPMCPAQVPTSGAAAALPAASDPDALWMSRRLTAFERQDHRRLPPQEAIVFVGSSIFEQWMSVTEQMAPLPVFNRAVGGSQTDYQLSHIEQLVLQYRPRIIVYYCGSNDIDAGKSAAIVSTNFRHFVDRVAAELPTTKVIFASILRAPEKRARWNIVDAANAEIKTYATGNDRVIYVDINKAVFNSRGGVRLDLYQSDQLHYKPPAYVEFTRLIKPVLQDAWQSLQVHEDASTK
jgi:GDSL-like Lipase/Acylhydrolase family